MKLHYKAPFFGVEQHC